MAAICTYPSPPICLPCIIISFVTLANQGDRIDPSIRLQRAIHLRDLILVRRIIRGNPQTLRNPDARANTSLHLAAALGVVDVAVFLPLLM